MTGGEEVSNLGEVSKPDTCGIAVDIAHCTGRMRSGACDTQPHRGAACRASLLSFSQHSE